MKTYPVQRKDGSTVRIVVPENDRTMEDVADFLQRCITGNRFRCEADAQAALALLARISA